MPLYFFDVIDDEVISRDEFGIELAGLDEARDQAIVLLPDIARDELPGGERRVFACWVRDDRDRVVYRGSLTYQGEWPVLEDEKPV